jgi:hypothetical protein
MKLNNDWDSVLEFEQLIAEYCGSKYAVACDSNSNAIKLVLEYFPMPNKGVCIDSPTEYRINADYLTGLCIAGYSAHPFYYNDVAMDVNELVLKMFKNEIVLFSNNPKKKMET